MKIKLHPEDFNKNFGTLAIKLPMNKYSNVNNSNTFNMSYTTEEQAVSNYINLLLTKPGERYMQPEFGVGLQLYLFENNTNALQYNLSYIIRTQAEQWLPYIINDSIDIKDFEQIPGDSKHGINIIIQFRVTESGANKTISIFPGLSGAVDVDIS